LAEETFEKVFLRLMRRCTETSPRGSGIPARLLPRVEQRRGEACRRAPVGMAGRPARAKRGTRDVIYTGEGSHDPSPRSGEGE
jgi:hypothetical protein